MVIERFRGRECTNCRATLILFHSAAPAFPATAETSGDPPWAHHLFTGASVLAVAVC